MSQPQRNASVEEQMKRKRNYRLLVDPELKRDATKKIYRFDGCVPGEPPIPVPRDPRIQKTILGGAGKAWDIPVPRFKYDKSSVCESPECQVYVDGISPSITPSQLKGTFSQVGPVVYVKVHRHPTEGRVLGAASVGFKHKGDGRVAVESLHGFQLYGCTLSVQLDDLGEKARQFLRDQLEAKKHQTLALTLPTLSSEGLDKMSDSGQSGDASSSRNATPLSDDLRERSNSLTSPITPSSAGLPSSSSSSSFSRIFQQHFPPQGTRPGARSSPSTVATPPPLPTQALPLPPAMSPTADGQSETATPNRTLTTPTHISTTPTHALISPTSSQLDTPDSGVSLSTKHEPRSTAFPSLPPSNHHLPPVFVSSLLALSVSVSQRPPQTAIGGNDREQPSCLGYGSGGSGGGGDGRATGGAPRWQNNVARPLSKGKTAVDCLVESAAASLVGAKLAAKTTVPLPPCVSVVSPISDISSAGSESPGIVVDNSGVVGGTPRQAGGADSKFINSFQPNPTASSGYSLATFDPSVSLQALMALKKVGRETAVLGKMETEDISGDESPEMVVNDVSQKPPEGGDTCEDMDLSDMECDSPIEVKIEVAPSLTAADSSMIAPAPLMGFPPVDSYPGFLPPFPLPPMGTFPPVIAPPIGALPLPPLPLPFLFPPPPLGHPPPPFLHPIPPIRPPVSSDPRHTPAKADKIGRYSQERQRQRKVERLSRDLKAKIMLQLRGVLLKDLQKLYVSKVGMDLADKHWESHLQRSKTPSEGGGAATTPSSSPGKEQPYRRMLGRKEVKELQDGHLSLAGSKRNRFVNFRIPTVSRVGSRSGGGVITMRRTAKSRKESFRLSPLYSDFSSSDSEREEKPKGGEKDDSGAPVKKVERTRRKCSSGEIREEEKPQHESEEEAKRGWINRREQFDDAEDDSDVSVKEAPVTAKRKYESEDDSSEEEEDEDEDEEGRDGDYYISQPGEDELSSVSDFSAVEEEEDEEPVVDVGEEVQDREEKNTIPSAVSVEEEQLTSPLTTESRKKKRAAISTDSDDSVRVEPGTPAAAEPSVSSPLPPDRLKVGESPPTLLKPAASPVHPPSPVFGRHSQAEEDKILSSFLLMGPDREDVEMFRLAWSRLRESRRSLVKGLSWAHYPCAVADPMVATPTPKRRRHTPQKTSEHPHKTGAARSEGYYKIDAFAKKDYVTTRVVDVIVHTSAPAAKNQKQPAKKEAVKGSGRVNRAKQRRLASDFASAEISSDLIKYGHLKARKKMVRFARSSIHGWGLFALEKIPSDEMVIEYVGEIIRSNTADEREHRYEAMGIGSSYLFRLDGESVIDATKRGGVARFINHCCDPNCYAKVIVIGSSKKIVIYSKRDIHANEEITYDYKFPIEDEKIPCLCGAPQCRGTLN